MLMKRNGEYWDVKITDRNVELIKLYAYNFTLRQIAMIQHVLTSTIKTRLKRISIKYPQEFENACGIRKAYKHLKISIRNPEPSEEMLALDSEFEEE